MWTVLQGDEHAIMYFNWFVLELVAFLYMKDVLTNNSDQIVYAFLVFELHFLCQNTKDWTLRISVA